MSVNFERERVAISLRAPKAGAAKIIQLMSHKAKDCTKLMSGT